MAVIKTYKVYAVKRGEKWLDHHAKWSCERDRKLYNTKTVCIRALNEADKIGIKPSDPFQVALNGTDTYIVSVVVRQEDIEVEQVPVTIKMKKFKFRNAWYKNNTIPEGVMPSYDVDAMPGFSGY